MYYSDYHTHTNFSTDSNANMVDMIEKAAQLGMKEIAITDHIDFDYPDPNYPFLYDYEDFKKSIDACKDIYKHKIKVLSGVEIGYQPHVQEDIEKFIKNGNFEFIICSTHSTDKKDICDKAFFEGKTKQEAYNQYLDDIINCIKNFDNFNIYGHLDYIIRYCSYEDNKMNLSEFSEKIDEILKLLISKGKGIEVNTSGLRYGVGSPHPSFEIIQRYRSLGGEIITIGSDAHKPEHIGYKFDTAYELLDKAGFKYVTIFKNRKPDFIKLSNLM